jgi:UDP-2,3-diacylglucosamine pyrophosphatase LpxH
MHYDSIIISDLHLGAKNCEAKRIRKFLHKLKKRNKISTDLLIIAGDGFDNLDADRLKKKHHKVIKMLRNLSKKIRVIWLHGNHDPDRLFIHGFIKVEVKDDFIIRSGDKKIFVTHGHSHDKFLSKHPIMTNIADAIYNFSQFVDPTHSIAKTLKRKSKAFLKCAKKIGLGSALVAKEKGCDIVSWAQSSCWFDDIQWNGSMGFGMLDRKTRHVFNYFGWQSRTTLLQKVNIILLQIGLQ